MLEGHHRPCFVVSALQLAQDLQIDLSWATSNAPQHRIRIHRLLAVQNCTVRAYIL